MERLDLSRLSVRELNQYLHRKLPKNGVDELEIVNPNGLHSIAVGLTVPVRIRVLGHAGYYLAGMNQQAEITVQGNVGWSVAENMMSGTVRIKGFASECAGASAHGGLLVIEGSASSRCGISMKGVDIVVGKDVGHMSAFMAQAGNMVVCGDTAAALGDSLYEAIIYVGGKIHSLGADAREEPMQEADRQKVTELLRTAAVEADVKNFKRVASAKTLYHWNVEEDQEY